MLKHLLFAIVLVVTPSLAAADDSLPTDTSTGAPPAGTPSGGTQNTIQLVWTVFLGGINLGTVGIKSSFSSDGYSAVSRLKTAGVVNSFYAAVIDASAMGTIANAAVHPQRYDSSYTGEKSLQKVALAYAAGGMQLSSDPPYDLDRFPVSDEQKRDTVDPLSGIISALAAITVTPQRPCGDTVRVFDGRRRYDVELKFIGNENSSSSGYSGPTTKCEMRYRQVAGFKQTLTKTALPTITVWFATFQTKEPGPVKSFIVPVKLLCDTPFGAAIAHARKITIDGEEKSS